MTTSLSFLEKDWLKKVNSGGPGPTLSLVQENNGQPSLKRRPERADSDEEGGVASKVPAPPINDIYRSRQQKRVK